VALALERRALAESERIIEQYVASELERQGYVTGEYVAPEVPDTPEGSHPLFHAGGTVRYTPTPGATVITPTPPVLAPIGDSTLGVVTGGPASPCSLDDLDVTINCVVDGMAEPSRPWGRLVTSGLIEAWGQKRVLPEETAGRLVLQVAPAAVLPKWRLDFLGGAALGSTSGLEAGLAWTGKSRLGGYTVVEWQPETWRLHGGVRVRLK